MTTGWQGLLEYGQRSSICRVSRTVLLDYGPEEAAVAAAELSVLQDLSKDYGPTGSSGRRRRFCRGSSTCKGLWAGRIRQMAMQEYTAASGRINHATSRERADESV